MEGFLPAVNSAVEALVEADPSFEAWLDVLGTCQFYPAAKAEWAQVRQGVTAVEQEALIGGDVQAGLDALQAEVTKKQAQPVHSQTGPAELVSRVRVLISFSGCKATLPSKGRCRT